MARRLDGCRGRRGVGVRVRPPSATSRPTERLVLPRGARRPVSSCVALASYALQALAWPLQRGRDSWDYWLTFLQLADRDPPFSALQVFRTPVAPLVTGIPMWLGGAPAHRGRVRRASTRSPSSAGRGRSCPISRQAALATALVLLVTPTYAGLFHDVSSDPVFAFVLAWWAGAVVRAWNTGTTSWLAAVGVGVALLTLCRPASQVAAARVRARPARRAPRGAGRSRRESPSRSRRRCSRSVPGRRTTPSGTTTSPSPAGSKAWVPFFRVGGAVDPANGDASRRLADAVERHVLHAAAVREPRRRRPRRTSTGPATSR